MGLYDWSKVPENQRERIELAIENYDLDDLLDIYYEFNLGKVEYCCPFDGMYQHFKQALSDGSIK